MAGRSTGSKRTKKLVFNIMCQVVTRAMEKINPSEGNRQRWEGAREGLWAWKHRRGEEHPNSLVETVVQRPWGGTCLEEWPGGRC